MKSHTLAKELLKHENLDIVINDFGLGSGGNSNVKLSGFDIEIVNVCLGENKQTGELIIKEVKAITLV